jgi:putative DNA primase/helicase
VQAASAATIAALATQAFASPKFCDAGGFAMSLNPCLQAALDLALHGLPWTSADNNGCGICECFVFPVGRDKTPWTSAEKNPSERPRYGATRKQLNIRDYFKRSQANLGIETGVDFFVVEADTPEGHPNLKPGDGIPALENLIAEHDGDWPDTRMAISPTGSTHYYFHVPVGIMIGSPKLAPGVDVKGHGGYVCAPPSIRPIAKGSKTLGTYRWQNELPIAEPPSWLIELCKVDQRERFTTDSDDEVDPDKVVAALDAIRNDAQQGYDNNDWYRINIAAWRGGGGDDELVRAAFFRMSARSPNHKLANTQKRWKANRKSRDGSIKVDTLYWYASQSDPTWRDKAIEAALYSAFAPTPDDGAAPRTNGAAAPQPGTGNGAAPNHNPDPGIPSPPGRPAPDEPKPDSPDSAPAFSEDFLALQFTKEHAGTLRYVSPWGKWLIWNGAKWDFDEKLKAYSLARQICRKAAKPINKKKEGKTVASARTRAAVISLAQSDPCHAASTDQWDRDLWLLNTPDGVIDLKTGIIRPHTATDYMTKICAVSPDRAMPIPQWQKFLARVTANDIKLQEYMQRMAGYGLTGVTIEHALFFLYGTGRNGKGVFLNTVAQILYDYHVTASQETFIASTSERHPTDLAMLRGARLVTVAETEQGKRWAESRIKQMTGGDRITARFMRQDFFEYDPQFKLLISGQHRPGLNAVNEAIKSRFNMVPFTVTIPEKERDKNLTKKLESEWPGILAWAIEGCLQWQKIGLSPPPIVVAATTEYLKGEDKYGRWIDERCERVSVWTSSSELFASWKSWAEENNEYLVSQTKFSNELKEAGFEKEDRRNANGFKGLRVLPRDPFTEHGEKNGNRPR